MKRLVCTLVLCAIASWAWAQGSVQFSILSSKRSIVRTLSDSERVIYSENVGFVLYNGTDATRIDMPVGLTVYDFQILDGQRVYFCGTYGGRGAVGYFDIAQTFAGGGVVNYTQVSGIFVGSDCMNCSLMVDTLTRLSVGWIGGQPTMAMIGEVEVYLGTGIWAKRTTVLSAYLNGVNWHFCAGFNKDGRVRFTDIDMMDNYVVAVATDSNFSTCYVKTYEKLLTDFPSHMVASSCVDNVVYSSPKGPALVAAMGGDRAAVVQYDKAPGVNVHFLEFNTVPGRATAFQPSMTTSPVVAAAYNNMWKLYEARYSKYDDRLYVLAYMRHPMMTTFDSWLLPITMTYPYGLLPMKWELGEQMSMDLVTTNQVTTAGFNVGVCPNLYPNVMIEQPNSCYTMHPLGAVMAMPAMKEAAVADIGLDLIVKNSIYYPTPMSIEVSPDCY